MASHGARKLTEALELKGESALGKFRQAAIHEMEKFREPEGIPMIQRARFTLARK